MTRVVGTAGHIDHGKTTLLRALTGIDADRLPEEKRRGLTIDVGYAHMVTARGDALGFVDVPGHDRLVGNMLVGAGEIDACLLVVAADDGARAQTLEHIALLDALAVRDGVAVVTKTDLVPDERVGEVTGRVRDLLAATSLRDSPVLPVSAQTGAGLDALADALAAIAAAPAAPALTSGPSRLAVDRAFGVRGRGVVVTGTARGEPISVGERLRGLPDGGEVRVRGIQVHDREVAQGPAGGRVALLLGGDGVEHLRRGHVLVSIGAAGSAAGSAAGGAPVATRRLLVALRPPGDRPTINERGAWPPERDTEARVHIGTDQADALAIARGQHAARMPDGAVTALLRLDREVAARVGDRFVLRQPPPAGLLAGGLVLDPQPPAARGRKRQTPELLARLVAASASGDEPGIEEARLALHGVLRIAQGDRGDALRVADDARTSTERAILDAVAARHAAEPDAAGAPLTEVREVAATALRRVTGASRKDAVAAAELVLADVVASGRLRRHGDVVAVAGHRPAAPDPARAAAMERLVAALDAAAPPSLRDAAVAAGCPPDAVRELEREGRIVLVDDDLAWARPAWERLLAIALGLARTGPMTPAALRDASGTSRKYVMALLEDFQRRGILTRTAAGHVPGPRA